MSTTPMGRLFHYEKRVQTVRVTPIIDIEHDGDRVAVSYLSCMCGRCEDLRIEITPEGEKTQIIDTHASLEHNGLAGAIQFLAERIREMQEREA
ncbi:MAG: hypothetical protein KDK05_19760 [Candidatus Competibacteraceae bacterium]|nr:hypothetical protein [Candidatus Competibacteraceae bacterium]